MVGKVSVWKMSQSRAAEALCANHLASDRSDSSLLKDPTDRIRSSADRRRRSETSGGLGNPQAQAIAPKRPLGRIIVDRLKMLSCALVACLRRNDRCIVEIP